MTTLVTGATGFLGNNVVRRLVDRGAEVRVLVRKTSDRRALEGLPVDIAEGDVCDADSVERAAVGVELIIHSAGCTDVGWTRRDVHEAVNVEGTRNVVRGAERSEARLVHVSSVNALGIGDWNEPADEETARDGITPCPYVDTKRAAEREVLDAVDRGLSAVIVNPGFMLGPWDWKPSSGRMLIAIGKRFAPFAPKGGCNLCDARDVAEGILLAGEKGQSGRRYILGAHNISYFDCWQLMSEVANKQGPWCRAGPIGRWIGGVYGDLCTRITGNESDMNSAAVRMSSLPHYFSSARAETELGYRTRPARETVEDAWRWLQQVGYV